MLEVIRSRNFSRLGVYRDRPDRIVGILNVHDYLARRFDAKAAPRPEELMRPPATLRRDQTVSEALVRLQAERRSMAWSRRSSASWSSGELPSH